VTINPGDSPSFRPVLAVGPEEYQFRFISTGRKSICIIGSDYGKTGNASNPLNASYANCIRRKPMRILFLTSAHNSLSRRLWIELGERGHEIRVCGAATDEAMIAAVSREAPDLIIAPILKIAIPDEVRSRHLCLIVHPGIKGDRGPSSLDWAIANHEKIWGVTILVAAAAFDAGPIWASHEFALEADPPAKSSLYRGQVTEAAVRGVIEAVARIESGEFRSGSWQPQKLSDVAPQGSPALRGCLRPPCGRPTVPSTGCTTARPWSCEKSARRTAIPACSARY
jgi:folate-dependent phosphoribosylglycinamide formyltransferase PurN